jgi:hypothetical protein
MHQPQRPLLLLTLALTALTGCGPEFPFPVAARTMYVTQYANISGVEYDTILAFPTSDISGTVSPAFTLNLPAGFNIYAFATGPDGSLYVGGATQAANHGEILIFAPNSSGSATPSLTLPGGSSGTFTYPDFLTVNSSGKLFVYSDDGSIEAFAPGLTATSTPAQVLTWGQTNFAQVEGLATDAGGDIFILDYVNRSIYGFQANTSGVTPPTQTITGTDRGPFSQIMGLASDLFGNLAVINSTQGDVPGIHSHPTGPLQRARRAAAPPRPLTLQPDSTSPAMAAIFMLPAGSTGEPTILNWIGGSATKISIPYALTMDGVDNLYELDLNSNQPSISLFTSGSSGNVAPLLSLTSPAYNNPSYQGIAVF